MGWNERVRAWLTACVHVDVRVCPPRMRLVLACVNTNISEDRPSARSCSHSMFGPRMLKCLCRWEAQVSIFPGPELNQHGGKDHILHSIFPKESQGAPEKGWVGKVLQQNVSKLSFNL